MEYLLILSPTNKEHSGLFQKHLVVSSKSVLDCPSNRCSTFSYILKSDHLLEDLDDSFVWYPEVDINGQPYSSEEKGLIFMRGVPVTGFRVLKPYYLI